MINFVGNLSQQKTRELPWRAIKTVGTSTLQTTNSIPEFDGTDYVEWPRSFNDIFQIYWHFVSTIVSGLENLNPSRKVERDIPLRVVIMIQVTLTNVNPSMFDAIRAWDSANEHFFSILISITVGAAQSFLLQL